ncbi:DNA-binding protein [Methylocaldum sp. BRCS4]|nr:DNA-binding protein [Methylocaldum sp. BRCS4]
MANLSRPQRVRNALMIALQKVFIPSKKGRRTTMTTTPLLLWSLEQAGEALGGISARTVRRLIQAGELPAIKIRSLTKLRPADVEAYIVRCAGQAVPTTTGDDTCQSASNENETRMGSSSGRIRRTGGRPGQTPAAERFGALLKFDAKMIRERKEQRRSGRNGS